MKSNPLKVRAQKYTNGAVKRAGSFMFGRASHDRAWIAGYRACMRDFDPATGKARAKRKGK